MVKRKKTKPNSQTVVEVSAPSDAHAYPTVQLDNNGSIIPFKDAFFTWLISPMSTSNFYSSIFEKRPMLITHNTQTCRRYKSLFDIKMLKQLIPQLEYTYGLDVVKYIGNKQQRINWNHNNDRAWDAQPSTPGELVDQHKVWKRFTDLGWSLRVLHPQRYCPELQTLIAGLESHFGCNTGCNAYLTPADTQGFAPHFDDIDAIILQVSGKKRWRLYAPTSPHHILPRHSSKDFKQDELGECIFDKVLMPGDLLYMPRGAIHQAETPEDCKAGHSLHLTLSFNQGENRMWGDFLEKVLANAAALATRDVSDLRRALPRTLPDSVSLHNNNNIHKGDSAGEGKDVLPPSSLLKDKTNEEEDDDDDVGVEEEFKVKLKHGIKLILEHGLERAVNCAVDEHLAAFAINRLAPPWLQRHPPSSSPYASSISASTRLDCNTLLKAIDPGLCRVVLDNGDQPGASGSSIGDNDVYTLVYHCLNNDISQHAKRSNDKGEDGNGEIGDGGGAEPIEWKGNWLKEVQLLLSGKVVSVIDNVVRKKGNGSDNDAIEELVSIAEDLVEAGLLVRMVSGKAAGEKRGEDGNGNGRKKKRGKRKRTGGMKLQMQDGWRKH
jgi:hypothetical protein